MQRTVDCDKMETDRFHWTHTEGKWFRQGMPSRKDRGKMSERKVKVEIHGQYQGAGWM